MKITFCGAAKQVTGSMHLVTLDNGFQILLDCGLDYEQQKHFHYYPSDQFPFDPKSIDVVVLSHAHIDHSGNIPNLVRQGFGGKIICTPATAELSYHLLLDSANIQDHDYRKGKKNKIRKPKPLYTEKNVKQSVSQFHTLKYHQKYALTPDVSLTFGMAGHLLGAAFVKLEVKEGNKDKTLVFTGDWGRKNVPLLKDPEPLPQCDVLISESTYGGRLHTPNLDSEEVLLNYVKRTCVEKKGKLIIPAFSVGRTQAIVYTLNKLYKKGLLPDVKIFVDSPLAIKSTNIYSRFREELNKETAEFATQFIELFHFPNLQLIEDPSDNFVLQNYFEPCVIVSAAGMVEGGRIQTHIANHISNNYATILIAGFCSPGTLGHELLQGKQTIQVKGRTLAVYAEVNNTDVFSSHADSNELVDALTQNLNTDTKICLVHGDETNIKKLSDSLKNKNFLNVFVPNQGDSVLI